MFDYNYYPVCCLICDKIITLEFGDSKIKIIPKTLLKQETDSWKEILKFKNADSFIKIPIFGNKLAEIFIIKKIIGIIFIANCFCYNSKMKDFFEESSLGFLQSTSLNFFTVKLGKEPLDEEFFEQRISSYSESSEKIIPSLIEKPLYLTDDKNDIIGGSEYSSEYFFGKILDFLNKNCELSEKLEACFNIMYDFMYNQININYFLLSCQILEILLLKKEDAKKSKVANRSTALLLENSSIDDKKSLANRIIKLYKNRSDIVHEGKNYLEFYKENPNWLSLELNFSKNLFIKIIEVIIEKNLNTVDDIKSLTRSILSKDELSSYHD